MTEKLLPGLGSGALREALTTIRDHLVMVDENWYPNNEELRGRIQNMIAEADKALSLSSPIEPPPVATVPEEVRDVLTRWQGYRNNKIIWCYGANDVLEDFEEALAPSRQGAAKRVEG